MAACAAAYRATVVILIDDQGQLIFAYNNYLVATTVFIQISITISLHCLCNCKLRAAFQLSVFYTYQHARKSLTSSD